MADEDDLRAPIERLIRDENLGKTGGAHEARKILDDDFLGITRATGREQEREEYLEEVAAADDTSQKDDKNKWRWLDIADPATAPDLVEPGSKGRRKRTKLKVVGDAAVVRAVVSTRVPGTTDQVEGRYRNTFTLIRRPSGWRVVAWQVTELPG